MEFISLDYFAGYFDADGCVGISTQLNKNGHRIHQIKATVTSICPLLPDAFRDRFGGTCVITDWGRKQNPNNRVRIDWSISSKKCKVFFDEILPHLIFKPNQVEVALEMQRSLDAYPGGIKRQMHPEYESVMEYRLSLYHKMRDIKTTHYLGYHWDGGEFGENPKSKRTGQSRAKQDTLVSGRV